MAYGATRGNVRRPDEALAIWGILAKKLPLVGRRQSPERILALLSMTLANSSMFIFNTLQQRQKVAIYFMAGPSLASYLADVGVAKPLHTVGWDEY